MKPLVVVMGVCGSGKSTIGSTVADALNIPFIDADDLHSAANIAKMAAGTPLVDADRWPWLGSVGDELEKSRMSGLVVACSALKERYRDAIRAKAPSVQFVLLNGSRELLVSRLTQRQDHFMGPALLDSQLETLEPLTGDEYGFTVDIARPPEAIVAEVTARLPAG